MDPFLKELLVNLLCGNNEVGSFEGRIPKGERFNAPVPTPYREGWQIQKLFKKLGFKEIAEIEIGARRLDYVTTCIELVMEPCEEGDTVKLERLVCALADKREWGKHPEVAEQVAGLLNESLPQVLNKRIELFNGTPKLIEIGTVDLTASGDETLLACPVFRRVLNDQAMIQNLQDRWSEMERCYQADASLACLILLGSVLEGLLQQAAVERPKALANAVNMKGNPKLVPMWSLDDLVRAARNVGWISKAQEQVLQLIRDQRNWVHPRKQLGQTEKVPTKNTIRSIGLIFLDIVNQLAKDDLTK